MAERDIAGLAHPSPDPFPQGKGSWSAFVAGEGDFFEDRFDHAVGVFEDVVVPEPDHAVAVGFDHLGSASIGRAVRMLPAVAFDGEAQAPAGEIHDEIADLVLAGELDAELFRSQAGPQAAFGLGHIAAQLAGEGGQSLFRQCCTPIPNPDSCHCESRGQGKGLFVRAKTGRTNPCFSSPKAGNWGTAVMAKPDKPGRTSFRGETGSREQGITKGGNYHA